MDHLRLLSLMRQLQSSVRAAIEANKTNRHLWNASGGVVVMPETLCPWCNTVLRSNGIWMFSAPPRYTFLEGMIPLEPGKIKVVQPGHPNAMSGNRSLCLGTYHTGMALLAGPANLNDCPMGWNNLPRWYRTYWNHPLCKAGYDWFYRMDQNTGSEFVTELRSRGELKHLTAEQRQVKL